MVFMIVLVTSVMKFDHIGTFCSQPPLLSAMVFEIYERTGDTEFVKQAVPLLLKEHKFWNSGSHLL